MITLEENPNGLSLTDDEKAAKRCFLRFFVEGDEEHVDEDTSNLEPFLPTWYDERKFKRGQKYFSNNRAAIFASNMMGLISLLANYKGLQILSATGRSSTTDTAKRRYASTVLHTVCWYECELRPGSESWLSLMQVRRMHCGASKSCESRNIGFIAQSEMAATQFGFMGFALIRPQIFGIRHDNVEDLEGFVHFWAVIGHMLGIKDEYNLCLQPTLRIVKIICQAILRYILAPALQLETPQFKLMTTALLDGMKDFVPKVSYDYQMFLVRRAACVPGYQHNVDCYGEVLCRSIFSEHEVQQLRQLRVHLPREVYLKFVLFNKVPVYRFTKSNGETNGNCKILNEKYPSEDVIVENGENRPMEGEFQTGLRSFLNLEETTSATLTLIDYEKDWCSSLNNSRFLELTSKEQKAFMFRCRLRKFSNTFIGRFIMDCYISFLLWRIRRFSKKATVR